MRAYHLSGPCTGPEAIHLVDVPVPLPGPGEVRLAMRAVSLNFRDLTVARGQYGALPATRIPCSDGVGIVEALGAGVTDLTIGQRVAGCFMSGWSDGAFNASHPGTALGGARDGMLAEQVVLPASGVVPVPAYLTDGEAACLPCAGVTAYNALFGLAHTAPGDTVLVLGTGGVAAFAIQFARAAGATVYAVTRSSEKIAAAEALGAHRVFVGEDWDEQVFTATAQQGVDHVLELGGAGTLPKSIRAARIGGRISLIGTITGIAGAVPTANLLRKGLTVQGLLVGSRTHFLGLNRLLERHQLRPRIERTFAFTAAREAYAALAAGGHVGKFVIAL